MKRQSRSIDPIILRGDEELGKAIGFTDKTFLRDLRKAGLPYGMIGREYIYFPDKVKKWLEHYTSGKTPISIG